MRARTAITAAALLLAACSPPPRTSPALLAPYTEPWTFAGANGTLTRTGNYRLFTTETDEALRQHLPAFLEAWLDRYTSEFGRLPRPSMKLDTFLMAERGDWEQLTRQLMGEHAPTYLRIQRGGFASGGRAILFSIGRRDTFAIAAHEGWHQYTQRTFRGELPPWLEEGIGVYFEGLLLDDTGAAVPVPSPWANLERFDQLKKSVESGSLLPLETLLTSTPQDLIARGHEGALAWYAQAWALTHYLNERHNPDLRSILLDAAHGTLAAGISTRLPGVRRDRQTGADAFAAYFGPVREHEAPFRAYLRAIAAADRAAIAAGRGP